MSWLPILSAVSFALWLYLLLGRDGFWRARPRIEDERPSPPPSWPPVFAVVPARNEAAHVGTALRSLLAQRYPGELAIVLVDDHSSDRTGEIARLLTRGGPERLHVIEAAALPSGWSGKLWAVAQGLEHAAEVLPEARYALMTDADVAHAPGSLARMVAKAEAERLDLVSLMVKLRCASFWERFLIPPFVFFFQKLYPFAAVNDPSRRLAAAAGGCMLVRRLALREAGGIEAIRDRLIDDVALAQTIKWRAGGGRIWLGMSTATVSLRVYDCLGAVWNMVARSADTQLGHSVPLLIATVVGMVLIYLGPAVAVVAGAALADWPSFGLGVLGSALMAACCLPTAKMYGLHTCWSLTLPAAAVLYMAMTVDFRDPPPTRPRRAMEGQGATARQTTMLENVVSEPVTLGRFGCGLWPAECN